MDSVKDIKAPILEEMKHFEQYFTEAMKSNTPLLDKITHYIIRRKGKQMRPMFVFLCAKMHGEVNNNSYVGASLIELLHTASLVHDDVVDDANMRRGFFSLNALWKNKVAVLVGDYLLSRGLSISVENNQFGLLKIMSETVKEMSEGELLQIQKSRKLNIDEETYYEIIRQKTASLVAACCQAGTASVEDNEETVLAMKDFGEKVGMAFQIKDDLFDYGLGKDIGKPMGIDIKEKKLNLPIIYALRSADKSERKRILKMIKKDHNNPKKVNEIIAFVMDSGGIEYATSKMNEFRDSALKILEPFADSPAKRSLIGLVNYSINRKK